MVDIQEQLDNIIVDYNFDHKRVKVGFKKAGSMSQVNFTCDNQEFLIVTVDMYLLGADELYDLDEVHDSDGLKVLYSSILRALREKEGIEKEIKKIMGWM